MEPIQVKQVLQSQFECWGLPEYIRFDNGTPWGNTHHVPSALALWLVGLGIEAIFGRPRQSTDNGVVERGHGVLNAWVEPQRCANITALTQRLQVFVRLQREQYPLNERDRRSRIEAYPDLAHSPRSYHRDQESKLWDFQRVLDYLAKFRFQRKVEINGRITHFRTEYSLGRAYQRRTLTLCLDPHLAVWMVLDENGHLIARLPLRNITAESICNLTLSYPTKNEANPDAALST